MLIGKRRVAKVRYLWLSKLHGLSVNGLSGAGHQLEKKSMDITYVKFLKYFLKKHLATSPEWQRTDAQ